MNDFTPPPIGDPGNRSRFPLLTSATWIAFFGVVVTTLAWIFVLNMTARELDLEMRRINSENSALAHSLEGHVAHTVKMTDQALLFLKREYEKQGTTTPRMVDFIDELRQDPLLNQVGVVNAGGDLVLSAVPLKRPVNIAHREHFQVQAASDTAGLFVAKPVVTLVSGVWSVFLTRRLSRPDGSFGGVVTAGIDPRYFSDYFDALELGPDRTILLVGADGIIRARRSQGQSEVGQDISSNPLFTLVQQADSGSYEVVSPVDQQPKFASYHTVRGASLIVVVSELKKAALAGYTERKKTNYLIAICFTFLIAAFCLLLIRSVRLAARQNVRLAEELRERERASAALLESENKFRMLFNSVNDSIIIIDSEGRFLEVNEFICQLLGYSRAELLGLSPKDIDTPEAAKNVPTDIRNILQKGEHQFESEQLTRDGRRIPVEISARVVDYAGRRAILAVSRDITRRKAAETKIRQDQELIRSILDAVDDGFLVVDESLRVRAANRAFCRQTNQSLDEIIGQPCHAISHPGLALCQEREEECPARKTFATGLSYTTQHHRGDRAARELAVEVKTFPLKDSAGHVESVILTIRDVTEKVKMQEQIWNTQKLESVGILAGGIAHDFNNLLGAVLGNVSLAKMLLPADAPPRELLQRAEEACEHGRELGNRLLTFSKGGEPLKNTVLLQYTLRDSVGLALSGSNVSVVYNQADELCPVDADEGQMRQVFSNLTINAKDAMPDGGTLEVGIECETVASGAIPALPEGRYVKITFRDHGEGIPQQILGRLFDPYFSTKQMGNRKGQGLGLTICDSIVRKHDGLITVETELGKGAVFTIYLPASQREAAQQGVAPGRAEEEAPPREKILVMDDDPRVRDILGRILKHFGHTVHLCPDSAGTIRAYREALAAEAPYSLVILDLTIPGGKGGVETFRDLRKVDPHVRAMISSGYTDDPVLNNYQDHGFVGAITKPYTAERLKEMLAETRRPPT